MEEIKLPKWIRFKNNDNETEFFHLTKVGDVIYVNGLCQEDGKVFICNDEPIIKDGDKAQELIQDKDILQYRLTLNEETWETMLLQCDDYENELTQLEEEFDKVEVLKILTPNSDDGFTKQWEAESKDET